MFKLMPRLGLYLIGLISFWNFSGPVFASPMVEIVKLGSPAASLSAEQQGDPKAGEKKAEVCVACHGPQGNSVVANWPKLAGQLENYLIKELKAYRAGEKGPRPDPVMFPLTEALTDEDIADLAAYFSQQKTTEGNVNSAFVSVGERIYRGGNLESGVPACMACHGPSGRGNGPANFPQLSGQQPDYTLDQLKKFRSEVRKDDPNGIMRDIAKRMSDEEMKAVSNYVSGLH